MNIDLEEHKTIDTKEDPIIKSAESIIYEMENNKKKKHSIKLFILIPLLVLCLLMLAFSTVFAIIHNNSSKIANEIFINDIKISDMTREEALSELTRVC